MRVRSWVTVPAFDAKHEYRRDASVAGRME